MEEKSPGVLWKKRLMQKFVPQTLLQTTPQILELPASKTPGIYENYFSLNLEKGLHMQIFQ